MNARTDILFPFLIFLTTQLFAQKKINYLGEQLHYRIEYFHLVAGTIDFNVVALEEIDSTEVYHLVVKAQTKNIFSSLFKIQNTYESFFDVSTFVPLFIKKEINQRNVKHNMDITFNQLKNFAFSSDSILWRIPSSCHSFFSMIYFLRNQPFIQRDTIKFYVDSENQPSKAKAYLAGRKNIEVKFGEFNSLGVKLRFEALSTSQRPWKTDLLTNRITKPNSKITIWFSDDRYRLPLIIQFNQIPFNVKMILDKFQYTQSKK